MQDLDVGFTFLDLDSLRCVSGGARSGSAPAPIKPVPGTLRPGPTTIQPTEPMRPGPVNRPWLPFSEYDPASWK